MPELPEVETNRRYLHKHINGKTIASVELINRGTVQGNVSEIVNETVTGLSRHGKVLSILTTNNIISIHLKMTGQLLYAEDSSNAVFKFRIPLSGGNTMPASSTRVVFHFTDGSALYFNDSRRFGWIKILNKPERPQSVDALSSAFTEDYFSKMFTGSSRPVKNVLLDQDKVAGIGNIYANESLYEAGIHPLRAVNTLTDDEKRRLYIAVLHVLHEGVKHQGSSGKDESYLLPDGSRGGYQKFFNVYQREGLPCLHCGTTIKRETHSGRSNFYCPQCQK